MLMLKGGVKLQGLRPEMLVAIIVANDVYNSYGLDCVITSVTDSTHSPKSLHYTGCAADFRLNVAAEALVSDIRNRLTNDYDVVAEPTHIHIEYQPRGGQ